MDPRNFSYHTMRMTDSMAFAAQRYVVNHKSPGSFLEAVISNDLKEACARADDTNMWLLPVYVAYFYNEAPSACWGSPEKYRAWIAAGEPSE